MGPLVPYQLTTAEKEIMPIVNEYFKSKSVRRPDYGAFCQRLAIEAALNKPYLLPVIALNKFLVATEYPPSGDFGNMWMREKQLESTTYKEWMVRLMPRLAGPRLTSEPDVAAMLKNERAADKNSDLFARVKVDVKDFVQEEYPVQGPGNLFQRMQDAWSALTLGAPIHPQQYGERTVPGIPLFFVLAGAGMIAGIARPGPLMRLHLAWVATLAFLFMVVMLTGVMNSRYRFVFEPFCLLYIFNLLDKVAGLFIRRKP
jgi:hypothetical protein